MLSEMLDFVATAKQHRFRPEDWTKYKTFLLRTEFVYFQRVLIIKTLMERMDFKTVL